MSGVVRAEQADECAQDTAADEPELPYDLPVGVSSWAEWMDR